MFEFGNSKGNIIFIIILVLFAISNGNFDLMTTLLTLPGLILALTFHEYAHAKTSDKLGDPTPEMQGRLTLNPLAHMDPVGTAFLLFAGFGWGKPVEINPSYYRNPVRDNMLVAAAGPISNFILAIILLIIYTCISILVPGAQLIHNLLIGGYMIKNSVLAIIMCMIYLSIVLNVGLGVFNLLPLPPLDGSKILRYFLRGKAAEVLYTLERYSTIILLVLFITNIPSKLISPIINWIASGMMWVVTSIIGLFI